MLVCLSGIFIKPFYCYICNTNAKRCFNRIMVVHTLTVLVKFALSDIRLFLVSLPSPDLSYVQGQMTG